MIKKRNLVEQHLDDAFTTVVEGPPRRRSLRVSGLPYCSLLDAMLPREPEQMDFAGACYTTMGTYVHENWQYYMTLGELGADVYGGWKCVKCQREWKKYCFRPEPCCGEPLKYVEIEFRLGPLSGHVDLVVCYRNRAQRRAYARAERRGDPPPLHMGRWVAWELKTIGDKPSKPKRQHEVQIRTYCEMLAKCYGIDVWAYTVVYIGRKNLQRTVFGPFSRSKTGHVTREWMWRSIKGFKAATVARKNPNRRNITAVAELRPCRSKRDYEDYMARRYDMEKRTCPMLVYCSKSTKVAVKAALEAIEA